MLKLNHIQKMVGFKCLYKLKVFKSYLGKARQ